MIPSGKDIINFFVDKKIHNLVKRDSSRITQIETIIFNYLGLTHLEQSTVRTLYAIGNGRKIFKSSHYEISSYLDGLEKVENDRLKAEKTNSVPNYYKRTKRRIKGILNKSKSKSFPLFDYKSGGTTKDGKKYYSQFEMHYYDLVVKIYLFAKSLPEFLKSPIKTIQKITQKVLHFFCPNSSENVQYRSKETQGGGCLGEESILKELNRENNPPCAPKSSVDEFLKMMCSFQSIGVQKFDVIFTDLDKKGRGYFKDIGIDFLKNNGSLILGLTYGKKLNFIVRPHQPEKTAIVQLDDVSENTVLDLSDKSFLSIETSDNNYQVFLAIDGLEEEEKVDISRRLKSFYNSDPGANGSIRVCGSKNFKKKYNKKPVVRIKLTHYNMVTSANDFKEVPCREPQIKAKKTYESLTTKKWPSYQIEVNRSPEKKESCEKDLSISDIRFSMISLRFGFSPEEIIRKLSSVRDKAFVRKDYAVRTVEKAYFYLFGKRDWMKYVR